MALLAGCAARPPVPQPPAPMPPAATLPAPPERPVASPEAYVARAASYDQLMIRAGHFVSEASRDGPLLQLAGQLAADHRGLASQLSMAGRRLNLLPSPTLQPLHQQWLDELMAAPDVRTAYLRLARRVHQNSYAMHERFARRGASPTLKPVARNAAVAERRHWAELQP